jgi:hypothetical protein
LIPGLISILRFEPGSMPRDLYVHNNPLAIFVYLDDRATPAKLRVNMSQVVSTFGFGFLRLSESLICEHNNVLLTG